MKVCKYQKNPNGLYSWHGGICTNVCIAAIYCGNACGYEYISKLITSFNLPFNILFSIEQFDCQGGTEEDLLNIQKFADALQIQLKEVK